ncbi:ABC transporter ATP-binding protein [Halobacteriales archaeon Cl-PHB]
MSEMRQMATEPADAAHHVLEVRDLKKHFPINEGVLRREVGSVKAVDGVDLTIPQGEIHAIVGESGCGKSTLLETIMHLQEPTSGTIRFKGTDIAELSESERRALRDEFQIVFQNPSGALDPRDRVGQAIAEPLELHSDATQRQIQARVLELLHDVGLGTEHYSRYPHELSGGQLQRVAIARSLALNPSLVLLDEPTSALDVSVQSQIINLLKELKDEYNLTYMLVTHDLSVVSHFADRVSVMYLGNVVEQAPTRKLFEDPRHPYTKALISAVPVPDPSYEPDEDIVLPGNVPDPSDPPQGCRFHPRCPIAVEECSEEFPEYEDDGEAKFRCIRADQDYPG